MLHGAPLGQLLEAMRSGGVPEAEEAWGECFSQYYDRVWTRVYYVMRTIYWLREPREEAADVAGQVFLGLREAVRNYRDQGKPEQWLMRVALRTALRHKESITGKWTSGRKAKSGSASDRGRSYVGLDDLVQEIADIVDHAEADARFDLRRRLHAWEDDPDRRKYLPYIQLFLEGYAHEEIADRIGITTGTSRTWLWKIRQHLAEGLEDEMTHDENEVRGRDGEAGVHSILDRIPVHPGDETLHLYSDLSEELEDPAAVAEHLVRCGRCAAVVTEQRWGQAMLVLASEPPEASFAELHERWRGGERALLVAEGMSGLHEPELDEVVGRDRPHGDESDEP